MRICLFTPSFLPRLGGMEIVVARLAEAYERAGHEVTVLAKTPRELADRPPFAYPVVYYRRSRSQTWLLGSTARALQAEHARRQFDIIHAHQAYPTGFVAAKQKNHLRLPVVITSHRGDIGEASRYRRRWLIRRRMVWAMCQADAVVGVSDELKTIIDDLTAGRANSLVIPNGVDLDAVAPEHLPVDLEPLRTKGVLTAPYMLTLGRLHPYKGLDILLESIALLRSCGLQPPHLVIAGDGKIRPDLAEQAQRMGLAETVSFAGTVEGETKNWLLAHCLFFVQPSREEGMPLTVLEAMAAGKAVIGSDLPGIRQLVAHEQSGLLVPIGSVDGLAGAIARLLNTPQELAQLCAGARASVQDFAWPAIAARYLRLFEDILAAKAPAGRGGDCPCGHGHLRNRE